MAAVVRIRGLPYSAKADDILEFFKDVKIKGEKRGIFFPQGSNGRSNGEAFIELDSDDELEKAIGHHKEHIGRRYIEVFKSTKQEMDYAMGKNVPHPRGRPEFVVRLRGLPYDTEKKEIFAFFNGLDIAPNGIGLLVDHMGRCTGEAYVQFTSAEMLARAKEKHMEKIGHRYIEIFESTMIEANSTIQRQMETNRRNGGGGPGPMMGRPARDPYAPPPVGYYGPPRGPHGPPYGGPEYGRGPPPPGRPGPYARPHTPHGPPSYMSPRDYPGPPNHMGMGKMGPSGPNSNPEPEDTQSMTGHSVRLRGLPFSATVEEIDHFFSPLQPVNIRLRMNAAGRPTGEATVDFASHDEAKEAMKKDREKIGPRYIELFLASTPMGSRDRMGGGGVGSNSAGAGGPPYGQRPPTPQYGSGMARDPYYDDPMPYGSGSDYGSYHGYDDMGYSSGNDFNAMGYDGGYYDSSNGMGEMYDYRPPPRYSGYQWS